MILYHALKTLYPEVKNDDIYWHITNRNGVDTLDFFNEQELGAQPTQQQLESAFAEYEANEYQRLRQYPSLGDQLDMLWHAIDTNSLNKTSDFYTAIKAVKDAHPKE